MQIDFDALYDLSRSWHIIHEDLVDLEERTKFLLSLWEKHFESPRTQSTNACAKFG